MASLESWLEQATRHLSRDSVAQVRDEIRDHHELQREGAIRQGASLEEADRSAVAALGDAKAANRQYRRVMLTSAEARMLRDSDREAKMICHSPWLKRALFVLPVAAVLAAAVSSFGGEIAIGRALLLGGIAMGVFFAVPFLPIYTPSRARVYRLAKWAMLIGVLALTFGPDALKYFWLLASCLWIPLWTEWTRISIRKKLPVSRWPKHLYL